MRNKILITVLLSAKAFAAISPATALEVEIGGADTNGCGWVTGSSGTDWTQQTSAKYALTNGVTNGTTTVATASASADMVGNLAYIIGGTGSITAGWYQITAESAGVSLTVDRSTGLTTGTGVTINIGGACATPGQASAIVVSGNIVYLKYSATPFPITTAAAGSGGPLSANADYVIQSYNTTRSLNNSDISHATIQLQAATITAVTNTGLYSGIIFDGNSQTSARLSSSPSSLFFNITAKNFNTASTGASGCAYCLFTANSAAMALGPCVYCEAYGNTATPIINALCVFCLSYNNSGASTECYSMNVGAIYLNIAAYNCGQDGLSAGGSLTGVVINSDSEGNARYGYHTSSAQTAALFVNFASFGNGTSATNFAGTIGQTNATALSGSGFVAAGSSNFAPNSTSGAGASLRNAGFPSVFPLGDTNTYMDIGAARHQDPAGSSVTVGYPLQ